MTVKEFCQSAICSGRVDLVAIQKRAKDGEPKTIRYFWESTPDDVCPELEHDIANEEIEDIFYMFPVFNIPHIVIKQ